MEQLPRIAAAMCAPLPARTNHTGVAAARRHPVGPCGLCRAQNHLAVACGRLAGQSMLPSGVPGPAGWRWPRR